MICRIVLYACFRWIEPEESSFRDAEVVEELAYGFFRNDKNTGAMEGSKEEENSEDENHECLRAYPSRKATPNGRSRVVGAGETGNGF